MSFGRRRNRERRQLLLNVAKWLAALVVLAGIGYQAHRTGSELARVDADRLAMERDEARQRAEQLDAQRAALQVALDKAIAARQDLQQRYDADVPAGALAEVLGDVRQRLAAGLPSERLRQVVRAAEPVRRCDGPPVARRFRIAVGTRVGPDDGTTFAEGMIRVHALVANATDDVAKTAVVTFAVVGGNGPESVTGMPATHVFPINHLELQIAVTAGPVGFATATLTTCRVGGG